MFRAPTLPRTLEAALRDVESTKAVVRADAIRDLALHAELARDRVLASLELSLRDPDGKVRAAAATALADIRGQELLGALLVAVEDEDPHTRQMVIAALGEIGDARATERLRRTLSDKRPEVRYQAVMAFPRVAADRADAIQALVDATRDADPLVCHIALRMGEEVGDDEGGDSVDIRLQKRALVLLEHVDARVRVVAAIVLARSGDRSGEGILAAVANRTLATQEHEDEVEAIHLCGVLGLSSARPGLERRAFSKTFGLFMDPYAWHAKVALARMGHERAVREILRDLCSGSREVRTLAVAAAGRARLDAARQIITAMRGDAAQADPDAVQEALDELCSGEASHP